MRAFATSSDKTFAAKKISLILSGCWRIANGNFCKILFPTNFGAKDQAKVALRQTSEFGREEPMDSATTERQGTRVTFLDQTGAKSVEAVVADTVTVRRILPNIITKMNLPVVGPDGQPMSYSLDHKEGGRRLNEDQTLVQGNVHDGDHLIIYPEIVAG